MTHGWALVGGNPAPGSVSAVDAVVSAFARVEGRVTEGQRQLDSALEGSGVDTWRGEAANAFGDTASELPRLLSSISLSFCKAREAVKLYRDILDGSQERARTALRVAEAAQERIEVNRRRANDAGDSVRRLDRNIGSLQRNVAQVRMQRALETDATAAHVLDQSINRSLGLLASARNERAEHAGRQQDFLHEAHAAEEELRAAKEDADRVRESIAHSSRVASQSLEDALTLANLPSAWEQSCVNTKEFFDEYGPVILDILKAIQPLISVAALVFPPLRIASLAIGIIVLAWTFSNQASSKEGLTAASLLTMGPQVLEILVALPGVGGGVKIAADVATLAADTTTGAVKGGTTGAAQALATGAMGKIGGAMIAKELTTAKLKTLGNLMDKSIKTRTGDPEGYITQALELHPAPRNFFAYQKTPWNELTGTLKVPIPSAPSGSTDTEGVKSTAKDIVDAQAKLVELGITKMGEGAFKLSNIPAPPTTHPGGSHT